MKEKVRITTKRVISDIIKYQKCSKSRKNNKDETLSDLGHMRLAMIQPPSGRIGRTLRVFNGF